MTLINPTKFQRASSSSFESALFFSANFCIALKSSWYLPLYRGTYNRRRGVSVKYFCVFIKYVIWAACSQKHSAYIYLYHSMRSIWKYEKMLHYPRLLCMLLRSRTSWTMTSISGRHSLKSVRAPSSSAWIMAISSEPLLTLSLLVPYHGGKVLVAQHMLFFFTLKMDCEKNERCMRLAFICACYLYN